MLSTKNLIHSVLLIIIIMIAKTQQKQVDTNVLDGPLELCSLDPLTGYYRDGYAKTGPDDTGSHVVCAVLTDEFL